MIAVLENEIGLSSFLQLTAQEIDLFTSYCVIASLEKMIVVRENGRGMSGFLYLTAQEIDLLTSHCVIAKNTSFLHCGTHRTATDCTTIFSIILDIDRLAQVGSYTTTRFQTNKKATSSISSS